MHCYTRKEPVGVCGADHPLELPDADGRLEDRPGPGRRLHDRPQAGRADPADRLRLGELALEAGLPEGVLNVVPGDGETGAALVDHPDVDKIAFTGSTVVGREIGAKAGRALKRVTLELGGKSPNIILPDADLDAAVKGAYQAIYFNTGQACNAGSRLFVHAGSVRRGGRRRWPRRRARRALGPGPRARHPARPADLRRAGGARARLHRVGQVRGRRARRPAAASPTASGYFVEPTLFSATSDDLTIAREEIFGPVLVALPYDSLEEVAARANDTEYGLAAGVWTRDLAQGPQAGRAAAGRRHLGQHLERGRPAAPFGGFKASGVGREHGREGLEAYLENKTVWVNLD